MKKLLFVPIVVILSLLGFGTSCRGVGQTSIPEFPSDSIDVYAPLQANDMWAQSLHTYGDDSIKGHEISYRVATDSSQVYMDFDITILEFHPRITENLFSFVHEELLDWGFINEVDSIIPMDVMELTDNGLSQYQIAKEILDFECMAFNKNLESSLAYEEGFNVEFEICPVFLNNEYVTYKKYLSSCTGGMRKNWSSYLQTFDRQTGKPLSLEDIIKEDKMDKIRERVALHMASKYPIYDSLPSLEAYIDSLNQWKRLASPGDYTGATENRITLKNFPLNNPGLHEAGIVFTYLQYQLTPGSYECPVILLTYDEIRDCLKPPFNALSSNSDKLKAWNDKQPRYYADEEIDSIRASWGLSDCGRPWPCDISDWYKYRQGKLSKHYPLNQIVGTWIGYGHLYDPRRILTLRPDGSFSEVTEYPISTDENFNQVFDYVSTICGNYSYDPSSNKLRLTNYSKKSIPDESSIECYVKMRDPENEYYIVHSIEADTMWVADEIGDLWPYFRKR